MARVWRMAAALLVAGSPLASATWAAEKPVSSAVLDPMDTFQEMRLECLLLADPALGDSRLTLRRTGDVLEVRGGYDNEQSRRHAIDILKQNHNGTVRDLATVAVIPAAARKPMQSAALKKMAARRVKELLPSQAGAIQVESTEAGQLTVSGLALSMEDKVELSRGLKKLAGVVSVRNDLRVTPMMKDGRMVTLVTSDGRRTLNGSAEARQPAEPTRLKEIPMASGSNALVAIAANDKPEPVIPAPMPVVEKKATVEKPRDAQPPIGVITEVAAPVPTVARLRTPLASSRLWLPPAAVTVGGAPLRNAAATLEEQPANWTMAHAPMGADSRANAWRNRALANAMSTTPTPAVEVRPAPVAAVSMPKAPPRAMPELMPAPSMPVSVPSAVPLTVPPLKMAPSVAQPSPIKPIAAKMIEEEETVQPAAAGGFPDITINSTAELKRAVEKACGRHARKVTVDKVDGMYTIAISVRNAQEEKAVIDRMLNLPEVLSPKVRFEVRQGD